MKGNIVLGIIIGLVLGFLVGWITIQSGYLGNPPTPSTAQLSNKQLQLKMDMRKLWEDHITWTRMYIVSAASDAEDKDRVAARLLKNQEDIGNAIKPYYGNEAGNRLTELLKEHITTAVELVDAAKVDDQNALNAANTKWYDNANQIADFLSSANPNWPQDQMRAEMKEHLDLTKQETTNILNKRFEENIADYDKIHNQILKMSDMLSEGIIKQFPNKF